MDEWMNRCSTAVTWACSRREYIYIYIYIYIYQVQERERHKCMRTLAILSYRSVLEFKLAIKRRVRKLSCERKRTGLRNGIEYIATLLNAQKDFAIGTILPLQGYYRPTPFNKHPSNTLPVCPPTTFTTFPYQDTSPLRAKAHTDYYPPSLSLRFPHFS